MLTVGSSFQRADASWDKQLSTSIHPLIDSRFAEDLALAATLSLPSSGARYRRVKRSELAWSACISSVDLTGHLS
jgi:hypothetical protein